MATASRAILSQALQDFQEGNAEQARLNADKGREVTRGFERVFKALVEEEGRLPAAELLYYLVVFTRFCRVVDQARNICEGTVFAITGEPKAPKSYQILPKFDISRSFYSFPQSYGANSRLKIAE